MSSVGHSLAEGIRKGLALKYTKSLFPPGWGFGFKKAMKRLHKSKLYFYTELYIGLTRWSEE